MKRYRSSSRPASRRAGESDSTLLAGLAIIGVVFGLVICPMFLLIEDSRSKTAIEIERIKAGVAPVRS